MDGFPAFFMKSMAKPAPGAAYRDKPWFSLLLCGMLLMGLFLPSQTTAAQADTPPFPESFINEQKSHLQRLIDALDTSQPELQRIVKLWHAGSRQQALRNLLLLPAIQQPTPPFPAPPFVDDALLQRAEAACRNRFFILEQWIEPPRRPDGFLDWHYRGPKGDKEVAWMLNRHRPLLDLAAAWQSTGQARYRKALNRLLKDWVLANPYPDDLTFSPPWRALETARRILEVWPAIFASGALDPSTKLLLLASLPHHADALRHHASFWGGNHLITEKMALLQLSVTWPVFQKTDSWRQHAVTTLSRQFMAQSYPDGSYKELSNHYQRVVLRNARRFLQLLAAFDPDFRQRQVYHRIEDMWDFFAGATRPDGTGPLNNASDVEPNATILRRVWEFHRRPDWLHIASGGTAGTAPEPPHHRLFPYAGQVFLRNHWRPDGDWIYFDAGPYGTAHQHVDRLHLSAVLRGRPLLTDSGRYNYRPGPLKDFFQGPDGHATLLVDGHPPLQAPRAVSQPLPLRMERVEGSAYASARAAFPQPAASLTAPVSWDRSLVYHPEGFLLIIDHLRTFTSHQIQFRFPFHPDLSRPETIAALRPLHAARDLKASTVPGFYSPQYNQKQESWVRSFSGVLHQPTTFVWLLRNPDAPAESFRILHTGPDSIHLRRLPNGPTFQIPTGYDAPPPFRILPEPH